MSIPSDLRERVMQLDPDDREILMHDIWQSLPEPDEGWWEAWAEEIERRSREIEEGRAVLLSREEFEERIRAALAKASRS